LNIIFYKNISVKYKVSITNRFINLVQITIICALLSIIEESDIRTGEKMRIYLYVLGKRHRIVPLLVPFFIVMDEFDGKS